MTTKAVEYTKKLIEIQSVSGDEQTCLEFMANWMRSRGFQDIVINEDYSIGFKKGIDSNKALILTGHIDTVSAGNLESWRTDPWKPTIIGDKLHGLGASDMKGGIAAAMAAIESVEEPVVDTWLVAVSNEEVDGRGTAAFAKYFAAHYQYDSVSAVILEPTDLDRIEIGHRGNAFIRLGFRGQAGHGSQQDSFEKSALGNTSKFLSDIAEISDQLATDYTDSVLGKPTIVPTGVEAGGPKSPNKTPDSAYMVVDIRTTPALDSDLNSELDSLGTKYGFSWTEVASRVGSSVCDPDAPIIAQLKDMAGDLPMEVSYGATDQGFLQEIGIDTVVFGPGTFSQAHAQNEYIEIEKLEKVTEIMANLVRKK